MTADLPERIEAAIDHAHEIGLLVAMAPGQSELARECAHQVLRSAEVDRAVLTEHVAEGHIYAPYDDRDWHHEVLDIAARYGVSVDDT